MKKIGKMGEAAWVLGTLICAFGVALSTKAGFGLSMISAPPYIVHVIISKYLPFYTQGMSEYIWQAVTLAVMCLIIGKFKFKYLLSFVSAVIFGFAIDGSLFILGGASVPESMLLRIVYFVTGELVITLAVAFVFNTYLVPQAAECIVVEISDRFSKKVSSVKLGFDIVCAVLSGILALIAYFITDELVGVGVGTVIVVFINAPLIKLWGILLSKIFTFEAAFPKLEKKFK